MAAFLYHHEATPLPRFESQHGDMSSLKAITGSYDDGFALMNEATAMFPSPIHMDFTGPFVGWNVSQIPLDQMHPLNLGTEETPSPQHHFRPATIPLPSSPDHGLEIIHEWQELRLQPQHRPQDQLLAGLQSLPRCSPQAPELGSPVIKREEDSTSPYSSDNSTEEPFLLASPIIQTSLPDLTRSTRPLHLPHRRSPETPAQRPKRPCTTKPRTKRSKPATTPPPTSPPWTTPTEQAAPEARHERTERTEQTEQTEQSADAADDDGDDKGLSKRIAHKLSEKSRRNRLTAAIREVEKLLPSEMLAGFREPRKGSGGGGDAVADVPEHMSPGMRMRMPPARPATLPISKVDVAEMALAYIRSLRRQLKEARRRMNRAKAVDGKED